MTSRYDPLGETLRDAAAHGQQIVELSFADIARVVGSLPASAAIRQWWANSSSVQAQIWRAAGFRVDQVYLDRQRVRFSRAEHGNSFPPVWPKVTNPPLTGDEVGICVQFQWLDGGAVLLDAGGKVAFRRLPEAPGLYRMTLTGGTGGDRPRVYIGETDNLRRRLAGNYRNPGPTQQTNLRVNALLREHVAAGGIVALAITTSVTARINDEARPLDLTRKASRLLAENAALVLGQTNDTADIINLG